jgi:hypothetical protein
MNCENYKLLINELVDGELDSQTSNEVNLHVFACRNCEAEFERLNNEKQMYSHFLFEIEPPNDFSARFQASLEAENPTEIGSMAPGRWFSIVFDSFTSKPIFAGAIALIIIGFGYLLLKTPRDNYREIFVSQPETPSVAPPAKSADLEFVASGPSSRLREIAKAESFPQRNDIKESERILDVEAKFLKAEPKGVKANLPRNNKPRKLVELPKIDEEDEAKFKRFIAFEKDAANHLERTEMLLRSFRNVGFLENSNEYDVAYEKQRARKLLENNVQLRFQAETLGSRWTNEILSKVEPYLLEISNLTEKPAEEDVLEIKHRVKNQNLIASLQGF